MDNIKKYKINSSAKIFEAFNKLYDNKKKIICVLDNKEKVIGTLTEGDFLKAIWKKIDFKKDLHKILNKKFFYTYDKKIKKKIPFNVRFVPRLSRQKKLIEIIDKEKILHFKKHKSEIDIMIIAGGKGKRLKPYSDILPKPLMPIGKKTILEHILDKSKVLNPNNFYISLFHQKNIITNYLYNKIKGISLKVINEKKALGTAGSLSLLKEYKVSKNILVTNCDVFLDYDYEKILDFHNKNNNHCTIVGFVVNKQIPYGVCGVSREGSLQSFSEKPLDNYLVNSGIYVFKSSICQLMKKNNEYDMDVFIKKIIKKKMKIKVLPIPENKFHDIGTLDNFIKTKKNLKI